MDIRKKFISNKKEYIMSNVSRRKFIKSIGLCTVLATTGNIHDALSFFPSQLNVQNKQQSPLSEPNSFYTSGHSNWLSITKKKLA